MSCFRTIGVLKMSEKHYEFREWMKTYHLRNGRKNNRIVKNGELEITEDWMIIAETENDVLAVRAADDLKRFLKKAMGVEPASSSAKKIRLRVRNDGTRKHFCKYHVSAEEILITGNTSRGLLYGIVHLEDLMRLNGGPFLAAGESSYVPLARMRSTHSGSGLDEFPDWQLDAILHAGFTAIDVFVNGVDETAKGYCDLKDLIKRAAAYGLDVVVYSYMTCYVHPDDPGADQVFDDVYGKLFRSIPGAAAIHLVGESLEFPSRDETTVVKSNVEDGGSDGLQDIRQPTGYYPNSDYPAYIAKVCDTIHKAAPGVEVIFNTYNWGWAPLEARKKFLENFPKNVTLHVTYDIFKQNRLKGLACPVMDYSIFAEEPGFYFESEVKAAAEFGIKDIRVTSNLAGTTWDFGCVPYAPVPFRWIKRMAILRDYLLNYSVNSFYDSHHYGWYPNVCNDLAKAIFSGDAPEDPEAFLRQIAARDYGEDAADNVMEVWRIWSRAMDHYVASNEDQYGPWRVGPAYPFVFSPTITRTMDDKIVIFPLTKDSYRSGGMIKTMYQPYENNAQSPGPLRFPVEIAELEEMLPAWENGVELLEKTLPLMSAEQRTEGERLWRLGKFIRNGIRTTLGIKRWWIANMKLQTSFNREEITSNLLRIKELLLAERENVMETIPLVEADSRLGWEPRMDYVCDKAHLEWKLRQLAIAEAEIEAYGEMIKL